MNDLKIFENHQFGEIRVIEQDGEPWFVAADVCRALELEDTGRATARLDEDELTRIKIVSGGQGREVIAVNEPGLYSLVLSSKLPGAKKFRRWVTAEVLPSIQRWRPSMNMSMLIRQTNELIRQTNEQVQIYM